jgi:glycosyltransferase involved in cell wall biosynthesis
MATVAVIIPVHDRKDELLATLESVRAQSLADVECVIVDDRSTDGAKELAIEFAAKDSRFRAVSLPVGRTGAPAGRNFGVEQSIAPLVIFLDSDDQLSPDCLRDRVAFMQSRDGLDFAVWKCQVFRHTPGDVNLLWNKDTGEDDLVRLLKVDVPWQTTSPIWRRAAFAKFGAWDEEALSAQDWEFHLRAVAAKLKYERVPVIDHHWRQPGPDRDSIGRQSWRNRQHQLNRLPVIDKVFRDLESRGVLNTPVLRRHFAGIYFRAADGIAQLHSTKIARAIWRSAHAKKLITLGQLLGGLNYFCSFRFPSRKARLKQKLLRTWPAEITHEENPFFTRAPMSDDHVPQIAVVMSVYNNAEFLLKAIDSIRAQTFRDWQLIIVDDGSTDGSAEIVRQLLPRDWRIKLISRENKGLTVSLNEALAVARSPYIARMDGDDIALPERFEKQIAYLRSHPECVCLGSQVELIDPFDAPIEKPVHKLTHEEIDAELLKGAGWALVHPVTMMRRDAIERVGRYKEEFNNVEDLDLFLRLAEIGRVANLPDVLLKYRKHASSVNHLRFENQIRLNRIVVQQAHERRGIPFTPSEFGKDVPMPKAKQYHFWGWANLKRGNVKVARQHARALLKLTPLSTDAWRLAYCAWRGR